MAQRQSFRDAVTGVLKGHGYVTSNDPGDLFQPEVESFDLRPGYWRWDGVKWGAYTPPGPPPLLTVDALAAALVRKNILQQKDVDDAKGAKG